MNVLPECAILFPVADPVIMKAFLPYLTLKAEFPFARKENPPLISCSARSRVRSGVIRR